MLKRMSEMLLGENLKQALVHTLKQDLSADEMKKKGLKALLEAKGNRVKDTIKNNYDNFYQAEFGRDSDIREAAKQVPAKVYVTEDYTPPTPPGTKVPPVKEQRAFTEDGQRIEAQVGEYAKGQRVGRGEALIAKAARYPVRAFGLGIPGAYIADQFLGQPVEGTIDAVTLGLTNFKEDETRGMTFGGRGSVPYSVPYAQGTALDSNNNIVPNVAAPVPPLSQKDLDYEIQRQRKYIATNSITLRELERMQREAQMRNNYA